MKEKMFIRKGLRRALSFVLSLAMCLTLMPVIPANALVVKAAENSSKSYTTGFDFTNVIIQQRNPIISDGLVSDVTFHNYDNPLSISMHYDGNVNEESVGIEYRDGSGLFLQGYNGNTHIEVTPNCKITNVKIYLSTLSGTPLEYMGYQEKYKKQNGEYLIDSSTMQQTTATANGVPFYLGINTQNDYEYYENENNSECSYIDIDIKAGNYFAAYIDWIEVTYEYITDENGWSVNISEDGTISWAPIEGADSYWVGIGRAASKVYSTSMNLNTRCESSGMASGEYTVSISARDENNNEILQDWEGSYTYISTKEKLSTPENIRWEGQVIRWNAVEHANRYGVDIYANGHYLGSGGIVFGDTQIQLPISLETGVTYKFAVTAYGNGYEDSEKGYSEDYVIESVGAIQNVQLSETGILTWDAIEGAAYYDVSVGSSGGKAYGTSWDLKKTLDSSGRGSGTYTVSLSARDQFGNMISDEWTGSYEYISTKEKLSTPKNIRLEGKVLKWNAVEHATHYGVNMYKNGSFVTSDLVWGSTQTDIQINMEPGNTYKFSVTAYGNGYEGSEAGTSPSYFIAPDGTFQVCKDDLIMIKEIPGSLPVITINDTVIESNEDIFYGYFEGKSRWIYTSAAGVTSTYETDSITITEELYGGTIYFEVYSVDDSFVWASPKVLVGPVFKAQPVGGLGEAGEPYTITFDIGAKDYSFNLWKYEAGDWVLAAQIETGATSYDIPYRKSSTQYRYKLSADMNGVQVYTDEFVIVWKEDSFITQPVSGTSEGGKAYTITFANRVSDNRITLQKYNKSTGVWENQITFEKSQTSYGIPFGTAGETDRYRLALNEGSTWGNVFEVTWSSAAFMKQPVGGTSEPGESYKITFTHGFNDKQHYVGLDIYNKSTDSWVGLTNFDAAQTSYDIPYRSPGTTDRYRLRIETIGGEGVTEYSNEFEVIWGTDYFKTQPVGGTSEPGEPYTITFTHGINDKSHYVGLDLYNKSTDNWVGLTNFDAGQTSYDIPYRFPNTTDKYRLRIANGGGEGVTVYSDVFEVTWGTDYFKTQPVSGTSEPGEPYTITFTHGINDKSHYVGLDRYRDSTGEWVGITSFDVGQTTYDIPYGTPGETNKYRLRIANGGGEGVTVYSDEFEVIWGIDYFKTQPVSGTSEAGRPYTITFTHGINDKRHYVGLDRYSDSTGKWVGYTSFDVGQTTYDIPYGTPGETNKYRLRIANGGGEGVTVYSDEFEVTWGTDIFAIQPVGGSHSLNEDHEITFALKDYAEEASFLLQEAFGTSSWGNQYTITSPYVFEGHSSEYTGKYRLLCTYNGNDYYSDEFTVEWKKPTYEDSIGAKLEGYSLSLTDNIGVNFYMDLAPTVLADSSAKFVMQLPNGSNEEVLVSAAKQVEVNDKTYYVFDCHVAAKEMTDVIRAHIVLGDGTEGTHYEFTVQDYAKYILDHPSEFESAVPVVKAMLNYGASAQEYFEYNTGSLANAILSEADKKAPAVPDLSAYKYESPAATDKTTYLGTSLLLDSKVRLRFYYESEDDFAISNLSVKCDGVRVSTARMRMGNDGDMRYLEIKDITPAEYGAKFSVKALGVTIENASVYGYMANAFESASDNSKLTAVLKNLYTYGEAAADYTR